MPQTCFYFLGWYPNWMACFTIFVIHSFFHFQIICKIPKLILSGLKAFFADWNMRSLYTKALLIDICAVFAGILGSLILYFGGRKKTVFYIKVFLFFINMATFPT